MLVIFQAVAAESSGAAGGRSPRTTTIASVTPSGQSNTSAPPGETVRLRTAGMSPGSAGAERTGAAACGPTRARTSYAGTGESGATAPSTRYVARVRPTTCRLPSAASRVTLYSTSPPPVAVQVTVIDGSSGARSARTSMGAGTTSAAGAAARADGTRAADAASGASVGAAPDPAARGSGTAARLVVASGAASAVAAFGAATSGSGSGRGGGSGTGGAGGRRAGGGGGGGGFGRGDVGFWRRRGGGRRPRGWGRGPGLPGRPQRREEVQAGGEPPLGLLRGGPGHGGVHGGRE